MKAIIRIRMQLFFSQKVLVTLFIAFPILFIILSANFFRLDDFQVQTTMGIVDLDQTEMSERIIDRLQRDEAINISMMSMEKAEQLLIREEIVGIYVLGQGLEDRIKSGNINHLVSVYYLSNNYIAPGITDLIAPHFMMDVLRYRTIDAVTRRAFPQDPSLQEQFVLLFDDYLVRYQQTDFFDMAIIVNAVGGESSPLYSAAKATVVRYLVTLLLLFLTIVGIYQGMHIQVDQEHRMINRIYLSRIPLISYSLSNWIGMTMILFLMSILFFGLLVFVYFNYISLASLILLLLMYMMGVSVLSIVLAYIFKRPHHLQMSIPYLLMGIWFIGGWIYSDTLTSSLNWKIMHLIPGSLIKEEIIKMFLNETWIIAWDRIYVDMIVIMVYFVIGYFLLRREISHVD